MSRPALGHLQGRDACLAEQLQGLCFSWVEGAPRFPRGCLMHSCWSMCVWQAEGQMEVQSHEWSLQSQESLYFPLGGVSDSNIPKRCLPPSHLRQNLGLVMCHLCLQCLDLSPR